MRDLDEATIVAYADGELDAEATRAVEAALAEDPNAQALARELIVSAGLVRAAFAGCLGEPLPKRLVDAAGRMPGDGAADAPEKKRRRPWWAEPVTALAASVALLVVGFGGGFVYWRDAPAGESSQVAAAAEEATAGDRIFEEALENKLSGTTVSWKDAARGIDITVTPIRTYKRADGGYCRQYRVDRTFDGRRQIETGIACRTTAGQWIPRRAVIEAATPAI